MRGSTNIDNNMINKYLNKSEKKRKKKKKNRTKEFCLAYLFLQYFFDLGRFCFYIKQVTENFITYLYYSRFVSIMHVIPIIIGINIYVFKIAIIVTLN